MVVSLELHVCANFHMRFCFSFYTLMMIWGEGSKDYLPLHQKCSAANFILRTLSLSLERTSVPMFSTAVLLDSHGKN